MPRFKSVKTKNPAISFDPIQTGGVIRKFEGERFKQIGSYRQNKTTAKKAAEYYRRTGYKARVVKYKKGPVVFVSTRKKRKR